jgi:hypothetical protein
MQWRTSHPRIWRTMKRSSENPRISAISYVVVVDRAGLQLVFRINPLRGRTTRNRPTESRRTPRLLANHLRPRLVAEPRALTTRMEVRYG